MLKKYTEKSITIKNTEKLNFNKFILTLIDEFIFIKNNDSHIKIPKIEINSIEIKEDIEKNINTIFFSLKSGIKLEYIFLSKNVIKWNIYEFFEEFDLNT